MVVTVIKWCDSDGNYLKRDDWKNRWAIVILTNAAVVTIIRCDR